MPCTTELPNIYSSLAEVSKSVSKDLSANFKHHLSPERRPQATFPCKRCGSCCQSLENNIVLEELNRGDGTCKYFDETHSLCKIYDRRPECCNVRIMWEKYFSHKFTWQHFISINKAICATLKINIESCYGKRKQV